MYRVYDSERKCWIRDKVYMTPEEEVLTYNHSVFGLIKLSSRTDSIVFHRDIELYDKNNVLQILPCSISILIDQ